MAAHVHGPIITRPLKLGVNASIAYAHKKIYQIEHENIATQVSHKGVLLAEGGLRRAYRRHKTRRYRKVEKLSNKTKKLNARASYRKAVADNPSLQNSLTSRMIQKHKIKRQYAKAAREAGRSGGAIRKTASIAGNATNMLVHTVVKNPKVIVFIGIILLLFVMLSSFFSAISGIATGVGQAIEASSFRAGDTDIDDAAIAYSEWEIELRERLENIRLEFPGFDEYRIHADSIGHNPIELIAFLTATHQDFVYPGIRVVLRQIFEEQYQLTITPGVETRYRFNEYGEWIPFEWHVLTVTLTSRPFTEVIGQHMNAEQLQHFNLLMQSLGNRQYVGSPFAFNWLPHISSHYGWRIHPINGGREFHTGVDIALPTGTEILAAHNGTVTFAGVRGGYGNLVIIEHNGIETRYAHCDTLLVSAGQWVYAGDVIATVGSTGMSTGPHLHFEVIIEGRRLNPVFFALVGR